METLDLCKILKGYEGKAFYSPYFGIITLEALEGNYIKVKDFSARYHSLFKDGTVYPNGECMIFPSKSQRDWNKWLEEQKPKVPKTWSELVKSAVAISSKACINVAIDNNREPKMTQDIVNQTYYNTPIEKSALALLKIHQLIEVGYDGNITNEEWKIFDGYDENVCYTIYYSFVRERFEICAEYFPKELIAFHTKEQAEEFLKYPENIQLLKDYFMI